MQETQVSAADSQEAGLVSYRTISPRAVAAFVVALASPLALVTPLLLVVALAAMFLALLALRQIRTSPELYSGRWLALTALALSLFALAYTPARLWSRYAALSGQAEELCDAFLQALQKGDLQGAHRLSMLKYPEHDFSGPPKPQTDELTPADLVRFSDDKVVKKIGSLSGDFTFQLDRFEPTGGMRDADVLIPRYVISPGSATTVADFPLWFTLDRRWSEKKQIHEWRIREFQEKLPTLPH